MFRSEVTDMPDLFDYLNWRGDLSFEKDGFNEVDNLIFCSLSYLHFDEIVPREPDGRDITLQEAAAQYREKTHSETWNPYMNRFPQLLERCAETVRFKYVTLSYYVNHIDNERANQISAVVFSINKKEHYIAFRGTDDTIAGWKEDFLMSFKEVVLAQKQAVYYIDKTVPRLKGKIYVGGHSKGGNLAVFSVANSKSRTRDRITAIYNNDGPGFQNAIIQSEGYKRILSKIHTFIPKSSIVGMLLEHGEEYQIVGSFEKGLMSHNILTWEVMGTRFSHEQELTKESMSFNTALRAWLNKLSAEEREQFIEALFDIIQATGAQTVTDLTKERLVFVDAAIKKLKRMDKPTRTLLKNTILAFFNERQKIFKASLGESIAMLARKN
jgi:hypothetical protein